MNEYKKFFAFIVILASGISKADEFSQSYTFGQPIATIGHLNNDFYAQAVANLPIVCVDVVVYHPESEFYLQVLRDNPPAQDTWWVPGGRMYKGESFFQAAVRKVQQEVGITVEPLAILGVYSTIFPDSAWGCPTHTINIAIYALCHDNQLINLDADHQAYRWESIHQSHNNPYVEAIRKQACLRIGRV